MSEKILQLDPAEVLARPEDNSRFGLKQGRIDSLAASIMEQGGVLQPVEVSELEEPIDGCSYRLNYGFIRHAAVSKLNKEGAGLTLPAIVRPIDGKERLIRQISENNERENQSPMDVAVSIRQLMDEGVERKDIRRIFSRSGGKKGGAAQPASNAWVNIMLELLELPKGIQSDIHEGVIGVAAAYELGKATPDKRQAIVERAKAERERQAEQEAKDEEKFLKAEKAATEAESKLTEAASEEATLRQGVEAATTGHKAAVDSFRELQKADYLNFAEKEKAEHRKKLTEAEGAVKAAEKAKKDAANKLAKHLEAKHKLAEAAAAAKAKLEEAKSAKAKAKAEKGRQAGAALSSKDIKKAAAAEGESTGSVALNAAEMRGAVKDLAALKATPKVAEIAKVFTRLFAGELTTQAAGKELAYVTGELKRKDPAKPTGKTPSMTAGAAAQ